MNNKKNRGNNRAKGVKMPKSNKQRFQNQSKNNQMVALRPKTVGLSSGFNFKNNLLLNGTTIKHRELISKVSGSAFSQGLFKIQPGLIATFPWLSSIAINFEMYEFISLSFQFISTRPATDAGVIYMAIDYDSSDNNLFTDATQIMQMQGCVAGKIWDNLTLKFNPQNVRSNRSNFYTREFGLPPNTAVQDYDLGTLHYVTDGSGNLSVGALYVEYVIKLKIPQPILESPFLTYSFQTKYTNPVVATSTQYGRRLVANEFLNNHVTQPINSAVQIDGSQEYYKYQGEKSQSFLYELRAYISSIETPATIASFSSILSALDVSNNCVVKDAVTGLLQTGNVDSVYLLIGSTWQVIQTAVVTFNYVNNFLKIGLGNHITIPGTSIQSLVARLTPFELSF